MNTDTKVASLNTLAFDLLRILSQSSRKNEFFSPFSVLTALNMTLLGAKNNTEKQLFEGLRYSLGFKNSDEVHAFFQKSLNNWQTNELPFTLNVANRVLFHKSASFKVKEDYNGRLKSHYKANVDEVDFENERTAIVDTCNKWVNAITNGKIPKILESIDPGTVAVLLNAIYFKGMWEVPFNERLTSPQPFYNFGDKQKAKDVPLMYKSDVEIPLFSTTIDGEQIFMIELAYKGNMSMNILITKSLNGLELIIPKLNYELMNSMKRISDQIDDLTLPKFKIETEYDLCGPLMKLGIEDAFQNNADFSGIREEKGIKISKVIHKAAIEVNEEGTVAAAATALEVMLCCAITNPIQFRVDQPFLYVIKDTSTGIILFIGKVDEL